MKLSSIGEFGFIKRVSEILNQRLPTDTVGIGDDCAVIPIEHNKSLLVTTDMLVEDIHFLKSKINASDLGYKSLAVNLSDIAAMGGEPKNAYISIAVPPDIEVEWLDEFYAGIKQLADSESVYILGGDTTRSPDKIVINFSVIGIIDTHLIKYRSSAKIGDYICVTDYVGDSGAGLKILLNNLDIDNDATYLIQRHNKPLPQIKEGKWLSSKMEVHAMMDISDGIDSDLRRIMESSCCGALIEINKLPLSPELKNTSTKFGWDAEEIAVTGGEDYCLLVTVERSAYKALASEFKSKFGRPLEQIGIIKEKDFNLQYSKNGKIIQLHNHGYNHFN